MIDEERKKWIIKMDSKTKPSDYPSFEFEDDSGKYPKWLDDLGLEELEWYGNYLESTNEKFFE